MIQQPPPLPALPAVPAAGQSQLSAQDRADIAQSVRDAQATAREAQQIAAQAQREAGRAGAVGVLKDPGGRVIVNGPDGRQVIIDPKAGLDGDQIQELVQNTLQPARQERGDHGPPVVPVVAIVFTFLFLIAVVISRAFSTRVRARGAVTAALPPEAAARLARIEQAVEAVAIEVERISEAQRYSAQLLTERLPGGAAESTRPAVAAARGE
jgi:hypothetical protein